MRAYPLADLAKIDALVLLDQAKILFSAAIVQTHAGLSSLYLAYISRSIDARVRVFDLDPRAGERPPATLPIAMEALPT